MGAYSLDTLMNSTFVPPKSFFLVPGVDTRESPVKSPVKGCHPAPRYSAPMAITLHSVSWRLTDDQNVSFRTTVSDPVP